MERLETFSPLVSIKPMGNNETHKDLVSGVKAYGLFIDGGGEISQISPEYTELVVEVEHKIEQ